MRVPHEHRPLTEYERIAFGLRPRTVKGWIFWLRHWSPLASWRRRG